MIIVTKRVVIYHRGLSGKFCQFVLTYKRWLQELIANFGLRIMVLSRVRGNFSYLTHSLLEILPKNAF